jgi:3',5'-nucleoside bisphosphate phosphatase
LIDLHCHTNFSDGSLSPAALLERALQADVRVLAITDHDTIGAYGAICDEARAHGIDLYCGVELSTHLAGCERSVHLLGYFAAEPKAEFGAWLRELQEGRVKRNAELIARLQELGLDVQWNEVSALAQRQVGRPHFAQVLLRKGYVTTLKEAFERYLGEDGMAWVQRDEPSLDEAIAEVRGAGGMASLAHPVRISRDWERVDEIVAAHARLGLDAVECFHSEHAEEDERRLLAIAERYGLRVTGGSDFHGDAKPGIELGTGRGESLRVPAFVAEQLAERLAMSRGC